MVRDLQRIIGDEAREQCLEQFGVRPDAVAACIGGGSNAIGIFTAFLDDPDVKIFGFEAGGVGVETDQHADNLTGGTTGVMHDTRSFWMLYDTDQTLPC